MADLWSIILGAHGAAVGVGRFVFDLIYGAFRVRGRIHSKKDLVDATDRYNAAVVSLQLIKRYLTDAGLHEGRIRIKIRALESIMRELRDVLNDETKEQGRPAWRRFVDAARPGAKRELPSKAVFARLADAREDVAMCIQAARAAADRSRDSLSADWRNGVDRDLEAISFRQERNDTCIDEISRALDEIPGMMRQIQERVDGTGKQIQALPDLVSTHVERAISDKLEKFLGPSLIQRPQPQPPHAKRPEPSSLEDAKAGETSEPGATHDTTVVTSVET